MVEFDFENVKSHRLYGCLRWLAYLIVHITFRVKVKGLENIPKGKGYIVAPNHIHALDPVVVASLGKLNIHFMAKEELFQKKLLAWFLTNLNAFPVRRGISDLVSIRHAVKVLKKGGNLCIFPEGTRSKDGRPGQAKAGVALIAKASGADILPVTIYCKEKPHFGSHIVVTFGQVITNESLALQTCRDAQSFETASAKVMQSIVDTWEAEHEAASAC